MGGQYKVAYQNAYVGEPGLREYLVESNDDCGGSALKIAAPLINEVLKRGLFRQVGQDRI